jgi:hypothetical protein
MKFAPIVPIEYDPASLTDYHLVLAHQIVQDLKYRNYYSSLDTSHTIILDNSVIETGVADIDLINQAYGFLKHLDPIVVAPDVLRESRATLRAIHQFFNNIEGLNWRTMVVPQGKDSRDLMYCFECIALLPYEYIGIPRLTEDFPGGRARIFGAIQDSFGTLGRDNFPKPKYHLLGIQHTPSEVMWAVKHKSIIGCDSSFPLRAVSEGLRPWEVYDLRSLRDPDEYIEEDVMVRRTIKSCLSYLKTGIWNYGIYDNNR